MGNKAALIFRLQEYLQQTNIDLPLLSFAVALPFSSVPAHFNISNTPPTGATTIYGNVTATPPDQRHFVNNAIVINGSAACAPLPSFVIAWPFSTVLACFYIGNTPLTGAFTFNYNTIATPSTPHPFVTNAIVVNGNAATVPLPSSLVALPLSNPLRFSKNLAENEDLLL